MKILGVSGSPRMSGNTDFAVKMALDEFKTRIPGAETGFVKVTDYDIRHCEGCRHCMTHVECQIKGDDLDAIIGRLHWADLIILGAPIYWWGPPGAFKDFIDRTHGFYPDDQRFKGKKVSVITVAATSGYPSHQKIMTWLTHYGAEYLPMHKIKAREKDDLRDNPRQHRRLRAYVDELVGLLT